MKFFCVFLPMPGSCELMKCFLRDVVFLFVITFMTFTLYAIRGHSISTYAPK